MEKRIQELLIQDLQMIVRSEEGDSVMNVAKRYPSKLAGVSVRFGVVFPWLMVVANNRAAMMVCFFM